MRNPEILARALSRATESIQHKENMVPEKSRSRRRRRRRVSTSRSPLPADYPRAPLQDITLYMHILERTRTRSRDRMQMHGTTPRQPMIHEIPPIIPLQEMESAMSNPTSVLEDPLQETETAITNRGQETETTMANQILVLEGPSQQSQTTIANFIQLPEDSTLLNCVQLPEQEIDGLTTDPQTEQQNDAPESAVNHHGNIIIDSSLTTDVGLRFHHDYHIEEGRTSNVSMSSNQEHGRAFGTVLQSETWDEPSGRGTGGSRAQPKKKSSLKPLMKMR
ncbi:hypothetical protein SUGI_1081240 [Cryptomeria japonica]|nr:hypothetical protein SUGI_1081240 [Cryptomeria japonica]